MDTGLTPQPPLWVPCPSLSRLSFDALSPRGSLCQGRAEGPLCPSDPPCPLQEHKAGFQGAGVGKLPGKKQGSFLLTGETKPPC